MEKVTFAEIADWMGSQWSFIPEDDFIMGVSTDSRSVKQGEIFVPLSGENFDGHKFIPNAVKRGIGGFIYDLTQKEALFKNKELYSVPSVGVENTLKGYQLIAGGYLKKFSIPLVGITGSNGKTTLKEMLYGILSTKFKTLKSEKNFNNEVGVPATALRMDGGYQLGIFEMAMRGKGQIDELARIVEPRISVITNIGEAHFELLGSHQAIADTKGEILKWTRELAVLNADNRWFNYLKDKSPVEVVSFGINKKGADFHLISYIDMGLEGYMLEVEERGKGEKRRGNFHLPLAGVHNIYNALSACAVARRLGMSWQEMEWAFSQLKAFEGRMEIKKSKKGWTVLNDTYNASPASMSMALSLLQSVEKTGKKIAVLGDMLELGSIAEESHREMGEKAFLYGVDYLFTVGELGGHICQGGVGAGMKGSRAVHFDNKKDLIDKILSLLTSGDIVLVKGSRMMKMEEIVNALLE